jgi:hypothetical protein
VVRKIVRMALPGGGAPPAEAHGPVPARLRAAA